MLHTAPTTLVFSSFREGVFAFEARAAGVLRAELLAVGFSKPVLAQLYAEKRLLLQPADSLSGPQPANPATRFVPGDRIFVRAARKEVASHPMAVAPQILYEDPFVLAVHKPAGLLVHGDGTETVTLSDQVASYLQKRGDLYAPQAVQRLDVETTGVVLFSKTAEFQPLFDALVAGHDMRKRYLAVVHGAFPAGRTVIDAPLARDRHDARRMRVTASGGQEALTQVELVAVATDRSRSLLAVELGTGRKHQIRVHLSSRGYPIVGDPLYGPVSQKPCELMLHAYEERFVHPVTGAPVSVCAGWPQRFSAWFDASDLHNLDER